MEIYQTTKSKNGKYSHTIFRFYYDCNYPNFQNKITTELR